MTALMALAVGLVGLCVGFAAGFAVQRARLCSFGAVEDALIGRDWRRMKVFGLALAIALIGTQALTLAGVFDPSLTTYIPGNFAVLGALLGALMFGIGMALVGTCAFGSLVRLGGGDLRSLVTLMVFGVVGYAVLRGILARVRIDGVEVVALPVPGGSGSLIDVLSFASGTSLRAVIASTGAAALIWIVLRDARLRRSPRLLTAGLVLGLGVVAGWIATGVLVDEFDRSHRVQSLTFVAPVARALFGIVIGEGSLADFGVMSVVGVVAGSAAAAIRAREFRWEAFDDQHEMRRHLVGAMLMGLGGVLAGGCTIGQGLTAGSLTAVSWPVTVGGMVLGARIGISILVEGSILELWRAMVRNRRAGRLGAEPPVD
jgi:hypothetical protein